METLLCKTCNGEGWVNSPTGIKICPDCQTVEVVLELGKKKQPKQVMPSLPLLPSPPSMTTKRPPGRPPKNQSAPATNTATGGHNRTNGAVPIPAFSNNPMIDQPVQLPPSLMTWTVDDLQTQINEYRKAIIQIQFELFRRGARSGNRFDLCPVCESPLDAGVCINSDCVYGRGNM